MTSLPGAARAHRVAPRRWRRRVSLAPWSWLLVVLGGAMIGIGIVDVGPLVLGAVGGLAIALVSVLFPSAFTLVAIAATPIDRIFTVEPSGFTVHMAGALWMVAGLPLVLWPLTGRRLKITPGSIALMAYAAFWIVSVVWADDHGLAVRESFQFALFVPLFLAIQNFLPRDGHIRAAVWAFLGGSLVLITGALVGEIVTPVLPDFEVSSGPFFKVVTSYFHPVVTSTIAGICTVIGAALLLSGRVRGLPRLVLWYTIVAGVALQLLIIKRTEVLGLALAGAVLLFFYGWRRNLLYMVVGALAVVATVTMLPSVTQSFEEMGDFEEGTAMLHLYSLPRAGWEIFRDHPVLGGGAGAFQAKAATIINALNLKRHDVDPDKEIGAHDIVVKVGSEGGTVGVILLLIFLYVVFRKTYGQCGRGDPHPSLRQHLCRGLFAAMVLQLFVSLAQNPFMWAPFWTIMGLAYRTARVEDDEPALATSNGDGAGGGTAAEHNGRYRRLRGARPPGARPLAPLRPPARGARP